MYLVKWLGVEVTCQTVIDVMELLVKLGVMVPEPYDKNSIPPIHKHVDESGGGTT